MIRYYCKTTRSNRTYNFPLSLIYDRIKINSVPFHRSVSLHRETTRREFIYFKLARFLSTYMFHYLLFEEDIRLRPILFINHLGISRLKLYEWDEALERTRLRVFIRSLSPFIVWPRSRRVWSPENDLRSYGRQFVTVFSPPSHVSDRFWINRNRARRTFYPWLEDGRHRRRLFVFDPPLRIVLFNPREI